MNDPYKLAIESLGWQEVTMWFRWSKQWCQWEMNHIDYGHAISDKPEGKTMEQKAAWSTQRWIKRLTMAIKLAYQCRYLIHESLRNGRPGWRRDGFVLSHWASISRSASLVEREC